MILLNRTGDPVRFSRYASGPNVVPAFGSLPVPRDQVEIAELLNNDYLDVTVAGQIPPTRLLVNETPLRIKIDVEPAGAALGYQPLFLEAFGSHRLEHADLPLYAYRDWERRGLIRIGDLDSGDTAPPVNGFFALTIGLALLVLVAGGVGVLTGNPVLLGGALEVAIVATLAYQLFRVFYRFLRASAKNAVYELEVLRQRVQELLQAWLSWVAVSLLVALIAIGLPAAVLFRPPPLDKTNLVYPLQLLFIAIASLIPPLFYLLFGRFKLGPLRESFLRDVVLLDPATASRTDARGKYQTLLEQGYGRSQEIMQLRGTGLPILITTVLVAFGWTISLVVKGATDADGELLARLSPPPVPLVFGFLGAYFAAVASLLRRYIQEDLSPKAYMSLVVHFLSASIGVWLIFGEKATSPTKSDDLVLGVGPLLLAFAIGVVPESILPFVQKRVALVLNWNVDEFSRKQPLSAIEGLTFWDRDRLTEEGVENVENLAHHNLIELMVKTRLPTERLVDAFDQAILYLHMNRLEACKDETRDKAAGEDKKDALCKALASHGIRTATDLEAAVGDKPDDPDPLQIGADQMKRLRIFLGVLGDDDWMSYLRKWRGFSTRPRTATYGSPEEVLDALGVRP